MMMLARKAVTIIGSVMIAVGMTAVLMFVAVASVVVVMTISGLGLRRESGKCKECGDGDGKGFGVHGVVRSSTQRAGTNSRGFAH